MLPVTSVDAPSSWDIENGPPESGLGSNFNPAVLVSLTAAKPLVKQSYKKFYTINSTNFIPPLYRKVIW